MINCIALDDEPMALEVLKNLCSKIPSINLTHTFTQVSLAKKHLRKFPVDLIFLDIEMPDENGFDFYKSINQKTLVIFTTAYSKYAVEGFNVNAIDYLLKPITFSRFEIACNKAIDYQKYITQATNNTNDCIYIRSEYALVKIPFLEIIYLETMDDYIKIHTPNKTILTLMSMKKMYNKLPKNLFLRVHRSFIVSISNITSIRGKNILLGKTLIPIGVSYKKEVNTVFLSNK